MKNWLKKQKYKLLIALCSIISAFTLFLGINKTYAYETDTFSYSINVNNFNTANITETTINNKNGYLINFQGYSYGEFSFNTINNIIIKKNSYLMVNFYILNSNNEISYSLTSFNFYIYGDRINDATRYIGGSKYCSTNYQLSDNSFCLINQLSVSQYTGDITNGALRVGVNTNISSKMFIYNCDIVDASHIGLDYYYDTYYGQIEDNYNTLLDNYNNLQDNYDTLENNYNTLESNYNALQSDYDTLLSQKNALEQEIITKQNEINTLTNELNRLNSEYNNIINVSAPFNPNNIGVATVLFNNTLLDIPYDSFIIFDYFQIELDLFDFDLIDNYNANSNHLIITLNLLDSKDFGTLKYWCNMRDSVGDYLSIYYYSDSTLLYSLEYMNNEHTDTSGNMAPYYLDSANNVNRVVFDFFLNDDYSSNNPYSNNTDYLIQYGTYTQGYNDGLNAANEYNDIIINNYQNEIQSYDVMIDNLNEVVHNLKQQINIKDGQIKSYQQARNDYNLNNMIWTIASTPFESFKSIWNVDFFGVNISTMITGFITGIVVLWIIKKFFL